LPLFYKRSPPPLLTHLNIWQFAHNITKSPTNPTKHITKFFIVLFLIFKGFNDIIAIRLPKQTVNKRVAIELALSLHEPKKYVKGYLGLSENFSKVFPIFPFLWKKQVVIRARRDNRDHKD
jgi:hypothetical protein